MTGCRRRRLALVLARTSLVPPRRTFLDCTNAPRLDSQVLRTDHRRIPAAATRVQPVAPYLVLRSTARWSHAALREIGRSARCFQAGCLPAAFVLRPRESARGPGALGDQVPGPP